MLLSQPGFFDLSERYEQLSASGDPLIQLDQVIPWNNFRYTLDKAMKKERKSRAGRPPYDYVLMFKILVLQGLYNLSDHQIEFQIRDRLSFLRFLGLSLENAIPDEKTIWSFREALVKAGAMDKLFKQFNRYLEKIGYEAKCGSMIDASFVEIPKQRNSKEENKEIKEGKVPKDWEEKPNKRRQKEVDARWTKKGNENYYGYKDHINADAKYKLIRRYEVTPANEADCHCFEALLDKRNSGKNVWADCAYRTPTNEAELKTKKLEDRLQHRPGKGRYLPRHKDDQNHRRSKIRVRVEHVFGFMENSMNGMRIRTIGIKRAQFKIGLMNLVYNLCRYGQLTRLGVA